MLVVMQMMAMLITMSYMHGMMQIVSSSSRLQAISRLSPLRRGQLSMKMSMKMSMSISTGVSNAALIVGLNKYSHDASCCIVDASSGEILFSQSKERVTGKKHDGGSVQSIGEFVTIVITMPTVLVLLG
jgi:hypothetical protein